MVASTPDPTLCATGRGAQKHREGTPLIEETKLKVRGVQFFYRHLLRESKQPTLTEPEAFRHYFSAFIHIARSVPWKLGNEEPKKYQLWKPRWEATLTPEERRLLKFTNDLRLDDVKRAGVDLIVELEEVALAELLNKSFDLERQHPAYGMHRSANPGFRPPAKALRPAYYLEDKNGKVEVTAKCREYLDYLEKLVREFELAHS
jgi:hypothetical protein